ncbi:MAG: AAA-like domain-containing protein [Xenococcaceae cyanobacterium MO_207.B15]|nr:AAA-like domain-containing protein [Xenococcaceae cyanobacterium MO_207.B15]
MSNYVRRRGVILTKQGSCKLRKAKAEAEINHNFQRYTLEALSEETGLTPTTLSKVFTGSAGVDKRTLECCFDAFNLTLLTSDYLYLNREQDNLAEIGSTIPAETCFSLEPACDRRNTPLTHKMTKSQNNDLEPHPPSPPTVIPGGQMPLDSLFYIDLPNLESLCYETIQQPGAMLNIRAPKQMGKTSLMTRILAHASSLGYHIVSVSLQLAEGEILQNLERFLQWFCVRVSKQLGFANASADFRDNALGCKSNAMDYFEDVLLANLDPSLVIAIDELNQLFAFPDIASEFLLLLRTWSEQAKARVADSNPWHKLRLITVHSTEILMPSSLDPSLLNTALVIELPEFTLAQVQNLAERWGQDITEQQIEQLITLLGGHPYRLQLAFYYLQQQTITLEELLENSGIATALYVEHLKQQWWNLQRYPELLTVFTQILRQSSPVDCELEPGYQLQQMGLVHRQDSQASLACELFRPFFCDLLPLISS